LSYYAHGKLLLTGEYLVLVGAKALALPLKVGQVLEVVQKDSGGEILRWKSWVPNGIWFEGSFDVRSLSMIKGSDKSIGLRLEEILRKTRLLNPQFLIGQEVDVTTTLEFDPQFGLGSSSTLILNLARWANVDPFELQKITFHGSGYDIACGKAEKPLIYSLKNDLPQIEPVDFNPVFSDRLYFVYLGHKERSLDAVKRFNKKQSYSDIDLKRISEITNRLAQLQSLAEFEKLLREHEKIMASVLGRETIQKQRFSFYKDGVVKSLGAWGGDFVLVTSPMATNDFKSLMKQHGFHTVYPYQELVL
jgi:mevalonate kinase